MPHTLLTPTSTTPVVELSRTLFRKRILPVGEINYQGRKITFDTAYLADLARSYRDGAYDQVPFMLADADNRHTLDPERYRGEVTGVEVTDDGLYAVLDLAPDAAELVRKNPKLGVSARLVPQTDRADGREFGMAMQHVLGTLDPRVTGLGAWEEIALAGHDPHEQVIDLTHATYEGGPPVADPITTEAAPETTAVAESFWAKLRRAMGAKPDDFADEAEPTDEELARYIAETYAADEQPEVTAPEQQLVAAGAELSNPVPPTAIDLAARADLDEQRTLLAEMRTTLAAERFTTERGELVRRGVPPALVELARPLLESTDPVTVDLSNGVETRTVDAGAIARQMLDSMAGYIDLAKERGHAYAPDAGEDTKADEDKARALADEWSKQFGA